MQRRRLRKHRRLCLLPGRRGAGGSRGRERSCPDSHAGRPSRL